MHISTIKETIAKLGWPKKHLCDMDKGGALSVPLSHLPCLMYSMAHCTLRSLLFSGSPFQKQSPNPTHIASPRGCMNLGVG